MTTSICWSCSKWRVLTSERWCLWPPTSTATTAAPSTWRWQVGSRSIHLPTDQPTSQSTYLPTYTPTHLYTYIPTHPLAHPPNLPTHPTIHLPTYLYTTKAHVTWYCTTASLSTAPPTFETIMEDLDVCAGETPRFAVVVEGKPIPDILWFKVFIQFSVVKVISFPS